MLDSKIKGFIEEKNGSFLVVGSPGTGKTFQLLETIKYLISQKKVEPWQLLVFCFNRRWAKILRDKSASMLGRSVFEIQITTFFAYCSEIINKASTIGLLDPKNISSLVSNGVHCMSGPKILNAVEQWHLLRETIKNDIEKKNYPLTFRFLLNDNKNFVNSFIQEVFDFILRAQENLLSPKDLSSSFTPYSNPLFSEITGIYSHYRQRLLKGNLYNYGRLLEDTVNIFRKHEDFKKKSASTARFIIVDELQEINRAQFEIVKSLSQDNCIFFGNDDQCTYAFRGSMTNNFEVLYRLLSKQKKYDKNILMLSENKRNSPSINALSEAFINQNKNRIKKGPKSLIADDGSVLIRRFKYSIDEINFLIEEIRDLITRRKISPENIAVLLKGRGHKASMLESILEKSGILFLQRNSRTILDNVYIKYLLNFSKIIILLRKSESSGLSTAEVSILKKSIDSILGSVFVNNNAALVKRISSREESVTKKINASGKLKETINIFKNYRDISAQEFMLRFLSDSRIGIIKWLSGQQDIKQYKKEMILNTVGDFITTVKGFSEENPEKCSINDYILFLEDIISSSFLEEVEDSTKEVKKAGFINLMSYHQCKGLEFDAVFLPFINKGYLPSPSSKTQLYDMQVFNYFSTGKRFNTDVLMQKHFEDERKLFYNGMTRAKSFLFVTSNNAEEKSLFFDELENINDEQNRNKGLKKAEKKNTLNSERSKGPPNGTSELSFLRGKKKKWSVRKNAVIKTYKIDAGFNIKKDKFSDDLGYLYEFYNSHIWWRTRKPTVNRNNPFRIFKPVHSYSSLNTYNDCPYRFKLKYYFRIKEEYNLNILIGSIYHEVLKVFFNDSADMSIERLIELVKEIFEKNSQIFGIKYLKEELQAKALRDFTRFYEYYIKDNVFNVIVEKDFCFQFGDEEIKGRIDHINIKNEFEAELIDFKSGAKKPSSSGTEGEIQLKLYRMAVDGSCQLEFLKNKKIMLKYIFIGDEKSSDPVLVLPEGEYEYKQFSSFLQSIIEDIKSEKFDYFTSDYYSCRSCDFKLICPKKNKI